MQRTLLKFLAFELFERITRLDRLVCEAGEAEGLLSAALVSGIRQRLTLLKRRVFEEKRFFLRLYSEKNLTDQAFQVNLPRKLNEALYGPYKELCELSAWLPSLGGQAIRSELVFFLKDALPDTRCTDVGRRAVALKAEGDGIPEQAGFDGIFIETLSRLQRDNPLGWLGLVDRYAHGLVERHSERHSLFKALRAKARGLLAEDFFFRSLLSHCIALRILGPAYYDQAVAEALIHRDFVFLQKLEPALFYGLNHLNFVNKGLVILHEAAEKSRDIFDFTPSAAEGDRVFQPDQIADVLIAVEKVFPEKFAFTERSFQRAVDLVDRLDQGILLASGHPYPLEDLATDLQGPLGRAFDAEACNVSVYDLLGLIREAPNLPREIVNAGWIDKLERSPAWLYECLLHDAEAGFDRLTERLAARDQLLLKSIETSEVHRMLLTPVPQVPHEGVLKVSAGGRPG